MQVNASRNIFWQQCRVMWHIDTKVWKESTASTFTTCCEEGEICSGCDVVQFYGKARTFRKNLLPLVLDYILNMKKASHFRNVTTYQITRQLSCLRGLTATKSSPINGQCLKLKRKRDIKMQQKKPVLLFIIAPLCIFFRTVLSQIYFQRNMCHKSEKLNQSSKIQA